MLHESEMLDEEHTRGKRQTDTHTSKEQVLTRNPNDITLSDELQKMVPSEGKNKRKTEENILMKIL